MIYNSIYTVIYQIIFTIEFNFIPKNISITLLLNKKITIFIRNYMTMTANPKGTRKVGRSNVDVRAVL